MLGLVILIYSNVKNEIQNPKSKKYKHYIIKSHDDFTIIHVHVVSDTFDTECYKASLVSREKAKPSWLQSMKGLDLGPSSLVCIHYTCRHADLSTVCNLDQLIECGW